MKLLILGGTIFLGRHLIDEALKRHHEVWCFNRGLSGPSPSPGCKVILGNREEVEDLKKLSKMKFDAIIDTCGYVPRIIHLGLDALKNVAPQYIFASTISVYAPARAGSDETSPVLTLNGPHSEDVQRHYGSLKAMCESAVRSFFPKCNTIARLGFLVGPYDRIYRFPYWIERFMAGGNVLAPGDPEDLFQYIDIRDAAAWMILSAENKIYGDYNITGKVISLGNLLNTSNDSLGAKAKLQWVPRTFLTSQGITSFDEIPYNISAEDRESVQKSVEKAIKNGLKYRTLVETARDTANWLGKEGLNKTRKVGVKLNLSISREKELEILKHYSNINNIAT